MITNNFGILVLNQKTLKLLFILIIFLAGFLFFSPKQAEAASGYGWMGPRGVFAGFSGACGFPFDSDVIIYTVDSVTGVLVNADFIEGTPVGRGPTTGSGTSLTVQCWDPTSGIFIKVAEPGYRDFYGGIKWYNNDPRGRTARLVIHLARSVGSCEESCPSIETVEPTGAGAMEWFYDRPTSWKVRVRLLPFDDYGSNAIDDWLFELRQASGCCFPTFADYLDLGVNGGATWAASKNSMTTHDLTTEVNNKIPGPLPDGRYIYSFTAQSNGLPVFGTMDPDSAFPTRNNMGVIELDWTEFGIDRVTPDALNVFHWRKPYALADYMARIYDDDFYKIGATSEDELSGITNIDLYRVINNSSLALDPDDDALWGAAITNCFFDPMDGHRNDQRNCSSVEYSAAAIPDQWVHYRACSIDLVGNRKCGGNRFQVEIVDPWLETFDGDIGSRSGINQRRDLLNPDAVPLLPLLGPYTANHIISTGSGTQNNVVGLRNWRLRNYNINMTKFPGPIGNSIYDGLWQKYSTRCRGGPRLISPASFTTGALAVEVAAAEASNGCRMLEVDGVVDIDDSSWSASPYDGPPAVIFIPDYDGFGISMTIRRNMEFRAQTGLIFVTKGSINVCKNQTCGNPATPTVFSISGFYISDRPMYTDISSTSTPADPPLVIHGSVLSFEPAGLNWKRDGGGYGRSVNSAWNRNFPSEQIRYQPKYLWLFRRELGDVRTITQEIAP